MKIALNIDGQFGPMTGIQNYVDSLLCGLFRQKTEHRIVAFAPGVISSKMWSEAARDGKFGWKGCPTAQTDLALYDFSLTRYFPRYPLTQRIARRLDYELLHPRKLAQGRRRLREATRAYDLLHLPLPYEQEVDLRELDGRRVIVTIHDMTTVTHPETFDPPTVEKWARLFRFCQEQQCRILTVSEYSKADIARLLKIPLDRIHVTPLAPRASACKVEDLHKISSVRENFGIGEQPFILYAGTLEARKNLHRLLNAFAKATSQPETRNARLVLAGGSRGSYGDELQDQADSLGMGDRFQRLGYVSNEDLNALMSSCAAFAYISEYEGFGLPPLEAMACGAPVLASNAASLPEVVGDCAISVSPDDVSAIADALYRLLVDQEENRRLRALSPGRAALFSWDRTAELTLRGYEAALSS